MALPLIMVWGCSTAVLHTARQGEFMYLQQDVIVIHILEFDPQAATQERLHQRFGGGAGHQMRESI